MEPTRCPERSIACGKSLLSEQIEPLGRGGRGFVPDKVVFLASGRAAVQPRGVIAAPVDVGMMVLCGSTENGIT